MHTKPVKPTLVAIRPKNAVATLPDTPKYFQAIGIIECVVTKADKQYTITVATKQYKLQYKNSKTIIALEKQIDAFGDRQKLIVYPRVIHFPGQKEYVIGFELVGHIAPHSVTDLVQELQSGEFKVSGLWQYIPVCRMPVITVAKNVSPERIDYIKGCTALQRVRFMKATHLPIAWRDAPVAAFRFNPRAEKELQGKPKFVQIKARFNPSRDQFEFVSLLSKPSDEIPPFLKAGKKDKAEAIKAKRST
jgi:hypothetical protein